MGNGLGLGSGLRMGSMNTFHTPPSHRPEAARDVPDYGLPAGMNMHVSDLHALFAAAPHVCHDSGFRTQIESLSAISNFWAPLLPRDKNPCLLSIAAVNCSVAINHLAPLQCAPAVGRHRRSSITSLGNALSDVPPNHSGKARPRPQILRYRFSLDKRSLGPSGNSAWSLRSTPGAWGTPTRPQRSTPTDTCLIRMTVPRRWQSMR
jgi:hypothetical protein